MENRVQGGELWWLYAITGILSILFGIAALAWPGATLVILVWLYGFYALIYGIVELIGMFRAMGAHTTWWTHLLIGAVSIIAGLFVLAYPGVSSVAVLFVIAIWAIVIGLTEVVTGIGGANLLLLVTGVISILFGFVLFANPVAGALALIWVIGIFAIVRGLILLVGAFRTPPTRAAA